MLVLLLIIIMKLAIIATWSHMNSWPFHVSLATGALSLLVKVLGKLGIAMLNVVRILCFVSNVYSFILLSSSARSTVLRLTIFYFYIRFSLKIWHDFVHWFWYLISIYFSYINFFQFCMVVYIMLHNAYILMYWFWYYSSVWRYIYKCILI